MRQAGHRSFRPAETEHREHREFSRIEIPLSIEPGFMAHIVLWKSSHISLGSLRQLAAYHGMQDEPVATYTESHQGAPSAHCNRRRVNLGKWSGEIKDLVPY